MKAVAALSSALLASVVALAAADAEVPAAPPVWIPSVDDRGCQLFTLFKGAEISTLAFQAGPLAGQPVQLVLLDSAFTSRKLTIESPSAGVISVTSGLKAPNEGMLVESFKQDLTSGVTWHLRIRKAGHVDVDHEIAAGNVAVGMLMFDACLAARPAEILPAAVDRLVPDGVDVFPGDGLCVLNAYYELKSYRWQVLIAGKPRGAVLMASAPWAKDADRLSHRIDLSGLAGPDDLEYGDKIQLDESAAEDLRHSLAQRRIVGVPIRSGDQLIASLPIGGAEMRPALAMFDACWTNLRK